MVFPNIFFRKYQQKNETGSGHGHGSKMFVVSTLASNFVIKACVVLFYKPL